MFTCSAVLVYPRNCQYKFYINPYIPVMTVSPYEDVRPLVWKPAAWVMEDFLRSWKMDVGGCSNLKLFLEGMYSQIHDKFAKELSELKGLSFKLTVKLQL